MKNLLYLIISSFVLFVYCKEKSTENITSFTEKHDTITQQKLEVVEKEYIYDDIYYLSEDSTIFMEYHRESHFRFFLGSDTTAFFDTDPEENNGDIFDIFYKKKDIGGLYLHFDAYNFKLKKPNMIEVWFEDNPKVVPYGLADKYFSFRLKEEKE